MPVVGMELGKMDIVAVIQIMAVMIVPSQTRAADMDLGPVLPVEVIVTVVLDMGDLIVLYQMLVVETAHGSVGEIIVLARVVGTVPIVPHKTTVPSAAIMELGTLPIVIAHAILAGAAAIVPRRLRRKKPQPLLNQPNRKSVHTSEQLKAGLTPAFLIAPGIGPPRQQKRAANATRSTIGIQIP